MVSQYESKLSPVKTTLIKKHLTGKAILDVGAGHCFYTKWLLKQEPSLAITAIDHMDVQSQGFTYVRCDLEKGVLPFDDNSFDTVLAFDVIEHITNAEQLVRELWRVCKKDGILIGSVPHDEDKFLPAYNLTFYHRSDVTHKRYYLPESLGAALQQGGFEPLLIQADGGVDPYVLTEFVVPWFRWPVQKSIGLLRKLGLLRTDCLKSDLFFVARKKI